MVERRELLRRSNPVAKLGLIVVFVLVVTFSYDWYFPSALLLIAAIGTSLTSTVSVPRLFWDLRLWMLSAALLSVFFIVNRSLVFDDGLVLQITSQNLEISCSLGIRMVLFAWLSAVFVRTTEPVELIMSFVHQLRMRPEYAYAFLVAYRLAPTFSAELDQVRLAYEARGISLGSSIFARAIDTPRYLLPLLVQAVRKGERVGIAMDIRGLGAHKQRTYLATTEFCRRDLFLLLGGSVVIVIVGAITIATGLFRFSLGF